MGPKISDVEITHWFLAIAHNDHEKAQSLREIGVSLNANHPHLQMTGLMLASRMGHEALVDWLLAEGAAPSIQMGQQHQSALHLALEYAHMNCVHYLLASEANPNLRDSLGRTPLHYAVHCDTHTLTPDIRMHAIRLLAEHGATPDIPDLEGATPLHYSVIYNRSECALQLLKHGANPNAQTHEVRLTPCHIAVIEDQEDMAATLLANGASADIPTAQNWTVRSRLPRRWSLRLDPALDAAHGQKQPPSKPLSGLRKTQKVINNSTQQ